MKSQLRALIAQGIDVLRSAGTLPADTATPDFVVERPKDRSHGDFASNAAMHATRRRRQLLGPLGRKRRASKPSDIFIPTFPPGYRPFDRKIHRLFRGER